MERVHVISGMMRSVGYDAPSSTLEVEFVDGRVYRHFIVPAHVFSSLLSTSSKGRYYRSEIQDHFPATQVTDGV